MCACECDDLCTIVYLKHSSVELMPGGDIAECTSSFFSFFFFKASLNVEKKKSHSIVTHLLLIRPDAAFVKSIVCTAVIVHVSRTSIYKYLST